MKTKISVLTMSVLVAGMMLFTGCNRQIIDTTYTYNYAIINTGGSSITVYVDKWKDYEGEQLQIVATDGTVYLTSAENCVLIKK